MRRSANHTAFKLLLGVAAGGSLLLFGRGALAESHDGPKTGGPLVAVLRPVNRATGAINPDISLGSARFTQGSSKVDVLVQVNGISVAGSEEGAAADGTGNVYPRSVQIAPGTCEAAFKGPVTGAERLKDLDVRSDGSGTLFASTSTGLDKLNGQSVMIMKPSKPNGVPVACGVIKPE